jgi:hypothetical protein
MKALAALLIAMLGLAGCASIFWRPDASSYYMCVNTDVEFGVDYSWDPPHARLTLRGADPLELAALAPTEGQPRDYYRYADEGESVRLTVTSYGVYLYRTGQRELFCTEEVIVVT